MSRTLRISALIAVGVVVAACGGADPATDESDSGDAAERPDTAEAVDPVDVIDLTGTDDLRFDPEEFAVPVGEQVTVELTSEALEHDFVLEDAADVGQVNELVHDHESMHDHEMGDESDLVVVHADAGSTVEGAFTIDEPGTYTFFCAVPGHREAGMEGTLEVADATG